jgi:alpha-galactosidase
LNPSAKSCYSFLKAVQIIAITLCLCSNLVFATLPTPTEFELAGAWFEQNIKKSSNVPFSFIFGGDTSQKFIANWTKTIQPLGTKENVTGYNILYSDPLSDLSLTLRVDVYKDYPAVEWVLELKNEGTDTTGIIKDIRAADFSFNTKVNEAVILHHAKGSDHQIDDFAPLKTILNKGQHIKMAPKGGRSSDDTAFPFFNIERENQGVIVGIGWTGQWAAELDRNEDGSLALKAGMEKTNLRLYPGEKIRTPRMLLLFWQSEDRMRGHNMMRQFMLAHHTPTIDGKPAVGPFACNGGATIFRESERATENNMIAMAERYQQFGLQTDYWWIDAGWYGSMDFKNGSWYENVGNWYVRKEHFPNGLKPVSDAVKKMGMKFILWFEPERIRKDSWLFNEHPEWQLRLDSNPNNALLDLGNPEALQWLTDYISGMITENNIAVYRQDFNIRPLGFWQAADCPDRVGMTEIKYIEGLYQFWDELKRRHPHLLIDNCASGGRRLDLETATRSVPLWRSDYSYHEPNGRQNHTYGLSFYLPCHGTGCFAPDIYRVRSAMSSSLVCGWNLYETDFPVQQAQYMMDEYRKVRPYFWGNYYPLTDFSKSLNKWMIYQFHRNDLKEGMVLFFRRPHSENMDQHVKLHGLDENAIYEILYEDFGTTVKKTGKELMQTGISVRLLEKRTSLLITYINME